MTEVGFVGMGKLGLPVALAIESRGHTVRGYDTNPEVKTYLETGQIPYREEGLQPLLGNNKVIWCDVVKQVVENSDIIFIPIQTPHDAEYEGVTRLPEKRKDFDYTFLKMGISAVAAACAELQERKTVAVISTCLPGTFDQEIEPLLNEYVDYVYTPQFIAMGTVLEDYLNPEFNLIGAENQEVADKLEAFYATINDAPAVKTDITTAEGIKVFYNTYITQKILLANAHMQVAHELGMNIDDINGAMMLGKKRIVGPSYMRSGGPDSGGCHPRDLIALSWLGDNIGLKPNWFDAMAQARELQTEWTADLIEKEYIKTKLPVYIMGKSFKPNTNLVTGSGATLVANILDEKGIKVIQYDPYIDEEEPEFEKGIYFIATDHSEFSGWQYPEGSTILDLWRNVTPPEGCLYVPIGNPNAIQDNRYTT